jgi:hypothetical protein
MRLTYLRRIKPLALLSALALPVSFATAQIRDAAAELPTQSASNQQASVSARQDLYIVGLKAAPLALYAGQNRNFAAIPRKADNKLDFKSAEALAYQNQLRIEQGDFLAQATAALKRNIAPFRPEFTFQHAFNGMVLRLSAEEAAQLKNLAEVSLVEAYREDQLTTDVGPTLIGAPGIWTGVNAPNGFRSKGEGVVIGVIDSGANLASPAFTDDVPGDEVSAGVPYSHTNPLGAGNYLGWCNPTNPNHLITRDLCNDKLIGGWDFVDGVLPAGSTEAPGFEDENNHGSHTASTAAGNIRTGTFNGVTLNLSGVAPRANLVIYDACYTPPVGPGACPNVSTLASINQVVSDGVVDVINYSIGGGDLPWQQAASLAFLAATNAGVYVSTSAGNSGPAASTLSHLEPWVTTVAASTHSRVFGSRFDISGPAPVPPALQNLIARVGGAPYAVAPVAAPIIVSPGFANGTSDGCAAFPAGTFQRAAVGAIAVLRLGTVSNCGSGARRTAALAAGAVATLFVTDTPTNLGATGTTWQVTAAEWAPIASFLALANGGGTNADLATAGFGTVGAFNAGVADAMAGFSSRGPNPFALLKPDLSAPGQDILATFSRWIRTPAPGSLNVALNSAIGLSSGTSMSSPHNAGAAALIKAVNRSWTPSQIKSALITTAKVPMTKEDTITNSDPFDRGAGRVDLTRAARAGFLLDETGANFQAANPATGGNPASLNIASFQNPNCVGVCSFTRTLRGTTASAVNWTVVATGLPPGAVTVTPSSFSTINTALTTFTLTIDSSLLSNSAFSLGELTFTPSVATVPTARMAIAARAGLPDIDLSASSISSTVSAGATASVPLTIRNVGNPSINWSVDAGLGTITALDQPYNLTNGFATGFFSGQTPTPGGLYIAEDFIATDTATLRSVEVNGFMTGAPATALNLLATQITFKIYSDNAGAPAGNPEAGAAGEIYSCQRTPTGQNAAGLSFISADGARFALDAVAAAAAGCPAAPSLTAGTRYWFVIYPSTPGNNTARRWVWGRAPEGNFAIPRIISPLALNGASTTWTDVVTTPPSLVAFSLNVKTDVQCGAPWLSLTPTSATLGLAGSSATNVALNASALQAGSFKSFLCISSNGTDLDEPKTVVPVNLTVVSEQLFKNGFEIPVAK